jgi:hypothetical protein
MGCSTEVDILSHFFLRKRTGRKGKVFCTPGAFVLLCFIHIHVVVRCSHAPCSFRSGALWLVHMQIESGRNFEDGSEIGVVVFIQIPREYLSFHMKEQPAFFIMFYAFCNCILIICTKSIWTANNCRYEGFVCFSFHVLTCQS